MSRQADTGEEPFLEEMTPMGESAPSPAPIAADGGDGGVGSLRSDGGGEVARGPPYTPPDNSMEAASGSSPPAMNGHATEDPTAAYLETMGIDAQPEPVKYKIKEDDFGAVKTNRFQAGLHMFKGFVGAGIFLLPLSYNNSGYVIGPLLALLAGAVCLDSILMLVKRRGQINRPDVNTYGEIARHDLGKVPKMMVAISLITCQFGFCSMYLQFAAGLFHSAWGGMPYPVFVVLNVVIVTPLTFVDNMRKLALASGFATGCVFLCIVSAFGYCIPKLKDVSANKITPAAPIQQWPAMLGANIAALEGIGVVMPIENTMKNREKFPGVVKAVVGFIVILYTVFATICYLPHGTDITSSIIHQFPRSAYADVLDFALGIALLFTYPIQYVPGIQQLSRFGWMYRFLKSGTPTRKYAIRALINIVLGVIAYVMGPDTLGTMQSLIGAFAATFLAIIVPVMVTIPQLEKKPSPMMIKCGAYLVFGVFIMIAGTVVTINDALHKASPHKALRTPAPV